MNDPATWQRLETLLDELLDLDGGARRARLDALTGEDTALRAELERLLAADETDAGVLDRGLGALAVGVLDEEPEEPATPVGERVGPYRVVGRLGRGGMGEVLLAERADGDFEHRVALKIMRGGRDRSGIAERFRRERRILARLRHPNIAVLHDGGATEDGLLYFAMEYVEGQRITDWCDARRLGVRERVALFENVCRAVEYAHRNLVVHRDIKPSNVFVTADGTAKLLDFGIGKLLDAGDDAADETQATRAFLTPAFAAPEQVRGEAASTSADVFSLGMLLYVLLTGHHPHGSTSRSVELARAIAEDDPPPASMLCGRDAPDRSAAAVAEARGVTPAELRRRLRGDPDVILAKALRKNPDERYASAGDLREDLERFRASLPIRAQPPTLAERARKFVRRHRVGTAAGAVALLAIVAGVGGVLWQSQVAAHERDRARAVQDYLIEVFSAVDPSYEVGESLTAVDLVERGAARITDRFGDDPGVRAEIARVLGTVLTSLARYDRADEVLEIAREEHERIGDEDGLHETLLQLGECARWRGEPEIALARFREARELAARSFGRDDPRTLESMSSEATALQEAGRLEEGRPVADEALRRALRVFGDGTEGVAPYRAGVAQCLIEGGELDAAVRELREVERTYLAAGVGGTRLSNVYTNLGHALGELDRKAESEEVLRKAVAVLREEYGTDGHPVLASALGNLAGPLMQGSLAEAADSVRLAEAESVLRESAEIFARTLGTDHWKVGRAYSSLSVVKTKQGDIAAAGDLLQESVRITRAAVGDHHPALAAPLSNLARSFLRQKRYEEAGKAYEEAIALHRECFGNDHVYVSHPLAGYSDLCLETDRLDEAEKAVREAWEIRRSGLGAQHSLVVETRVQLAGVLDKAGRGADAIREIDGAVADARGGLPDTRTVLASALLARARQGRKAGEAAERLEPLLTEALKIREEEYGADDARTGDVRTELLGVRAAALNERR